MLPELEELLDERTVSEMLGVTRATLGTWRSRNVGPDYLKLGGRIRYTQESVQRWIDSCHVATRGGR